MKVEDWLDFFRRHKRQKIFHFQHFKVLTELKNSSLRVALKRLTDKRVIQRVVRSYYVNPFNLPTVEEISATIYRPSYISLESALYRHGILSQFPYTLTCVSTRLPRRFKTSYGIIEYRQIKKKYFFGFVKENSYFLAEPEKAVVDFFYLNPKGAREGIESELSLRRLNSKKLRNYAKRLGVSKAL